MASKLGRWWQTVKQHWAAIGVVGIGLVVVVALIIFGYRLDWTGFNGNNKSGKTLWDWLQLLIIPFVLAIIAILFNRTERKNEQTISVDNQHAATLEAYFDKMSDLLLKENLRNSQPDAEVRKIARARTLTALSQLDGTRKGSLIKFIYEAELIQKDKNIISLVDADLSGADLSSANLRDANLSGANFDSADLFHANLCNADLSNAALYNARMNVATLSGANLSNALLADANLRFAHLDNTNLSRANLTGADFLEAKFHDAILTDAEFSSSEIKELLTEEQLLQISIVTLDGDKMYRTVFEPDDFK